AKSGALVAMGEDPAGAIESLAYNPQGSQIATGGAAGVVLVWDGASLKPLGETLPCDGPGQIWRVQFDASGRYLAAAGGAGVALWQVADGGRTLLPPGRLNAGPVS